MRAFRIRRSGFFRNEDGGLVVEFITVLPMVIIAYVMGFAYFGVYKAKNTSEKAAFTVSDLISRETTEVDASYIDGMMNVYDFISSSVDGSAFLRVSSISYSEPTDQYTLDWSDVAGNESAVTMTQGDVNTLVGSLPLMADGDSIIYIETSEVYRSYITLLLDDLTFTNKIFIRPRFIPKLTYAS